MLMILMHYVILIVLVYTYAISCWCEITENNVIYKSLF